MRHHGEALRVEGGEPALVDRLASGEVPIAASERLRALVRFSRELTVLGHGQCERLVADLRAAGLDARAVHDAAQVVAYFNYVNRIALGLGVELEPCWGAE
ncbi:MAG: hypothetical protein M0Z66_05425 [Thermaerobacter sp.]|nr:hypothetical protein [Thermaerobacter sp.]